MITLRRDELRVLQLRLRRVDQFVGWTSVAQSTKGRAGFGGLRYRLSTLQALPDAETLIEDALA